MGGLGFGAETGTRRGAVSYGCAFLLFFFLLFSFGSALDRYGWGDNIGGSCVMFVCFSLLLFPFCGTSCHRVVCTSGLVCFLFFILRYHHNAHTRHKLSSHHKIFFAFISYILSVSYDLK